MKAPRQRDCEKDDAVTAGEKLKTSRKAKETHEILPGDKCVQCKMNRDDQSSEISPLFCDKLHLFDKIGMVAHGTTIGA